MAIYEMRTYTANVGKMTDIINLYAAEGWPVLSKYSGKLVGYFMSDVGALNQLVHLWRFDDDADRRSHWKAVFADEAFMAFAHKLRPLLHTQENRLLVSAPWGPTP